MNTVSYQFHTEQMEGLKSKIMFLWISIFFLIIACSYLGFHVYEASLASTKMKVFKTKSEEQLKHWIEERAAFVEHHAWKGKLRSSDAKKVAYYDSKIKELEGRNQAINLLEIKLSTP